MRILFLFMLCVGWLFGTFTQPLYLKEDIRVLKSFDIDEKFINDPHFRKMKESVLAGYRKDRIFRKYEEAYIFIPILKDMINAAGIPPAFLYLAMAESEFSVRAYSPKKAAGLWQFIPSTARLYDLQIDTYVDERRDPIKSTEAAIRFLKGLHDKFGKWYLAAIAYNCGPGRLQKAIRRAKSDDLSVLLSTRHRYLPRESRNYIRKILSLAMAFNSVDLLMRDDFSHFLNRGATYPIAAITLKGGAHLESVAESAHMSVDQLRRYNRHLRYNFIPPQTKSYPVYIPYDNLALFKQNYDPSKQKQTEFFVHRVARGETLSQIGKKYGLSWYVIKDANRLSSTRLRINQKLIIPNRVKPHSKSVAQSNKSELGNGSLYVIRQGDTIYGIARRFNISRQSIMRANSLKNHKIRAGDTLVIPN